ncbi:DUF4145 domain-containing protein [Serratia fonticola]|uniref:DUF4145 domain-containing protein n=1 Tax=Serratia fonticola TaxID=47917 RepID=UPI003AAD4244
MGLLSFNITCPHCLKENAVIAGFSEHKRSNLPIYDVAFFCRSCEQAGIAVVVSNSTYGPYQRSRQSNEINVVVPDGTDAFTVLSIFPKPESHVAPEKTPSKAAQSFIEAKDNIQRGRYETAVMLCRKVMDIATRNLLGDESKNETLVKRISVLHGKGVITDQMKDWAHIVRIDSNGAVHSDEEFTQEEAEEMIGFTEVFLIYSFTLPAMVSAKQTAKTE